MYKRQVVGNDGAISGFVMASAFSTYIAEQSRQIFSVYAAVLVVMLVVSFLLSHGTVRLLRSSLMAVSYTHLDVYKRQVMTAPRTQEKSREINTHSLRPLGSSGVLVSQEIP